MRQPLGKLRATINSKTAAVANAASSSVNKLREAVTPRRAVIVAAAGGSVVVGVWLMSAIGRVQQDLHQLHKTPTEVAKREFDASVEAVKAIVGGIGTIATIAGGVVLYLNFRVANKNAEIANRNVEIANRNAEIADEKLITERFTQAINQLGSDKLEVRLGGIYALERIAKDSPKDHWTIMEVLTGFVREQSLFLPKKEQKEDKAEQPQITTDVQAALTVIGRRNIENESNNSKEQRLNLRHTNLSRAFLSGANFCCASFSNANLSAAKLCRSSLSSANLSGADLKNADLKNADLSDTLLSDTNFSGTNLNGTNLNGADLSRAKVEDDQLKDAFFCNTTLPDGTINDRDCKTTLSDETISDRDCDS